MILNVDFALSNYTSLKRFICLINESLKMSSQYYILSSTPINFRSLPLKNSLATGLQITKSPESFLVVSRGDPQISSSSPLFSRISWRSVDIVFQSFISSLQYNKTNFLITLFPQINKYIFRLQNQIKNWIFLE